MTMSERLDAERLYPLTIIEFDGKRLIQTSPPNSYLDVIDIATDSGIVSMPTVVTKDEDWIAQLLFMAWSRLHRQVAALRAQVAALTLRAEQAERERDEARAFGVQAAKQYNELLIEHQNVTCAFCGEQYPRGTPRHGDGLLAEHIKTCRLHPLREAEAALTALRERLEKLQRYALDDVAIIKLAPDGPLVRWSDVQAALSPEEKTPC